MQIVLVLCEKGNPNNKIFKTYEWPSAPRKGEEIVLGIPRIMQIPIAYVGHYLDLGLAEVHGGGISVETMLELEKNGWSKKVNLSLMTRLRLQQRAPCVT